MSEQTTPTNNTAWIPMFMPDGGKINFTINLDTPLSQVQVQVAMMAYDALIAAGLTPSAPNNEGLDTIEVQHVIRSQVTNEGRTTDRIWMYASFGKPENGSQLTVYLNTDEDRAAFETAAGFPVSSLPIVKGRASPAKQSGDFERNAKAVSFKAVRKQEPADTPTGYKWEIVKYISANGKRDDFTATSPRTVDSVTIKFDDKHLMYFDFGSKMYTRNPLLITAAGVEIPEQPKHGDVLKFPDTYKVTKFTDQNSAIRVDEIQKAG